MWKAAVSYRRRFYSPLFYRYGSCFPDYFRSVAWSNVVKKFLCCIRQFTLGFRNQHKITLNKAIRRIIRDCNDEQLLKDENAEVLLPHFSCHSLRHTFTTRMCEAGVNVKVIQDALGHKDISTTLNIYTDVTKELKPSEFEGLDLYFKNE